MGEALAVWQEVPQEPPDLTIEIGATKLADAWVSSAAAEGSALVVASLWLVRDEVGGVAVGMSKDEHAGYMNGAVELDEVRKPNDGRALYLYGDKANMQLTWGSVADRPTEHTRIVLIGARTDNGTVDTSEVSFFSVKEWQAFFIGVVGNEFNLDGKGGFEPPPEQ